MNPSEAAGVSVQLLGGAAGFSGVFLVLLVEKRLRDWDQNWACLNHQIKELKGTQEFSFLAPREKIQKIFFFARMPQDQFRQPQNLQWMNHVSGLLRNIVSLRDSVIVFALIVSLVTIISIGLLATTWQGPLGCLGIGFWASLTCIVFLNVFVVWSLLQVADLDGFWVERKYEWDALRLEIENSQTKT